MRHYTKVEPWEIMIALLTLVAACGTGGERSATTEPRVTSTTTLSNTTSTTAEPATTTSAIETTTTAKATTTATATPDEGRVADVVAWIEAWLADQFERSDPPEGVIGPSRIRCPEWGAISAGDVLACRMEPRTETGFELDTPGVVIYVLDTSGPALWEVGTDLPDTTDRLMDLYDAATHRLMCRDLLSPESESETYPFSGVGRPEESAFFWSLIYWSLEEEPDRMDADGNGVPCETLYSPEIVGKVLEGGPVPLYLR